VPPLILAILQARMSSTRLPGKVLRPLVGEPMLLRQIERLRRCARIDRLVVATSDDASDNELARVLHAAGVDVFRGPLDDVLARYRGALETFGPADHVVRLTGDCPLADWTVIDATIEAHLRTGDDYTANTYGERTFAKGLDVDVVRSGALLEAAAEAQDPYEREHVLPFVYHRPERYRLGGVFNTVSEGELRWTVDLPEDYDFVVEVYDSLYPTKADFLTQDIRSFMAGRPDLAWAGGHRRI
jgi:spore coat polysaccharide biosynthesis protein SpsF